MIKVNKAPTAKNLKPGLERVAQHKAALLSFMMVINTVHSSVQYCDKI